MLRIPFWARTKIYGVGIFVLYPAIPAVYIPDLARGEITLGPSGWSLAGDCLKLEM